MVEGYALTITYVNGKNKVILTNSLEELIEKVQITYLLEDLLGGNLVKSVNVISRTQAMDALMGIGAWENDFKTDNALDDDKNDPSSENDESDVEAQLKA